MPDPEFYYITAAGKKAPLWTIQQVYDVIQGELNDAFARLEEMREEV